MAKTAVLSRALVSLTALVLAPSVVGCGPSVPASPTYEANVRPIFAAHCLSCHGNAVLNDSGIYGDGSYDPPPADWPANGVDPKTALSSSYRAYLGQCAASDCTTGDGGATTCRREGAQHFATTPPPGATSGNILSTVIHGGEGLLDPMPPLPAAALDDWEMKVVEAWIANPVCGSDAGP